MVGIGAARPKLARLASGGLLLSGGRARNRNTSDIIVWANPAGDGRDWTKHSVTDAHNRGVQASGSGLPRYPENVNSTVQVCGGCGWTSTYTSLLPIAATDSAVLVYDRCDTELCDKENEVFSMRLTMKGDDGMAAIGQTPAL